MELEEIIKRLKHLEEYTYISCIKAQDIDIDKHTLIDICYYAVKELSTIRELREENKKLLEMYQKEKAVCHATQAENEKLRAELERMKKIMRENGIMVIPSKYPGGPAGWNTQKPRGQKEE